MPLTDVGWTLSVILILKGGRLEALMEANAPDTLFLVLIACEANMEMDVFVRGHRIYSRQLFPFAGQNVQMELIWKECVIVWRHAEGCNQ